MIKILAVGRESLGMVLELEWPGRGKTAYLRAAVVDELTGKEIYPFYLDNSAALRKQVEKLQKALAVRKVGAE